MDDEERPSRTFSEAVARLIDRLDGDDLFWILLGVAVVLLLIFAPSEIFRCTFSSKP